MNHDHREPQWDRWLVAFVAISVVVAIILGLVGLST